jgi:acetyltransferase-like isoleucine patch superfamily enzyme
MAKAGISQMIGFALHYARASASSFWKLEARLKGVRMGSGVTLMGRPIISVATDSALRLGNSVNINSAARSNPVACFQPSVLRTLHPGAELILADGVGISGTVLCAGLKIQIGENTIIGSGAMLLDNDFHALEQGVWRNEYRVRARPIIIGKNVFIGARAIILKGVTIGDGAVIGAGAVVARDVPAGEIAAGNPAQIIAGRNKVS